MFDYVFFLKAVGIIGMGLFGIAFLLVILQWYYLEHTSGGQIEKLKYEIRGYSVGYPFIKYAILFTIFLLIFLSIR